MFSWATSQLETLAQTVAPPPSDPKSRYLHACQRGNQDEAVRAFEELNDPLNDIVIPAKNQGALHVACLYGLPLLVDKVITVALQRQEKYDLMHFLDGDGNTPLHCACMSNQPGAIVLVKALMERVSKAAVGTKNFLGQTPYDVSALNTVRQFLLPIQLQAETQAALDNGGAGLPPGIDLCGLKVTNSTLAPPPTMPGGSPVSAPPPIQTTPSPTAQPSRPSPSPGSGNRPPSAPSSTGSQYALRGRSSAALKTVKGIQPDGFHSSSSDKTLQEKYGHQAVGYGSAVPPPPSSGNSSIAASPVSGGGPPPPPTSGGPNPYSAGLSALSGGNRRALRYVAFDPINGASPVPPAPQPQSQQRSVSAGPKVSMFMPPPPAMSASRESSVSSVGTQSPTKRLNSQGSFSNPPTPRSMSPFAKPPAASATSVFSSEKKTEKAGPVTPSQLFARPPTMSSLKPIAAEAPTNPTEAFTKPEAPAAETFVKPPSPAITAAAESIRTKPQNATETFAKPASSVFAKPPAMNSVQPETPEKTTSTEPQDSPDDDAVQTDDEGEMDEVPLTPGYDDADGIRTSTGMPSPPLSQN